MKATLSLIDKGFKNIAHLANAPNLSITNERLDGYEEALSNNNIEVKDSIVRYCHHGGRIQLEVEKAVEYFLSMGGELDAIFVASDRLSMGCLTALNKLSSKENHPPHSWVFQFGYSRFSSTGFPSHPPTGL